MVSFRQREPHDNFSRIWLLEATHAERNKLWYKQAHKTIYEHIIPLVSMKHRKNTTTFHLEKMQRWQHLRDLNYGPYHYTDILKRHTKQIPFRMIYSIMAAVYLGWPTHRRCQTPKKRCAICNNSPPTNETNVSSWDSLQHYHFCPTLTELFQHFKLPQDFIFASHTDYRTPYPCYLSIYQPTQAYGWILWP